MVIPVVYDGWRVQSWRSTQGVLISVNLKRNSSSKSNSYNVVAQYEYTINGKQ